MSCTYIKEYVPCSWFHPIGIKKVLKRFWHRLPNVANCLFATFTIDREAMRAKGLSPSEAFDVTRDRVRKMFYELRQGVEWEGKIYKISSAYCTKVEFHADEEGWPHYHCIWLTRGFVPAKMLSELWGFGRTNIKRIQNEDFHYLLKYVCKSGQVPEWVQDRERMRIFQPSRGFLLPDNKPKPEPKPKQDAPEREKSTIRERLTKWEHMATVVTETAEGVIETVRQIQLAKPFKQTFDRLVYAVALAGRYLGGGKIQITHERDIYPWILNPHQNIPLHD